MKRGPSYRQIEDLANLRLAEHEKRTGRETSLPTPIDELIEDIYGLKILWEEIDERAGETILGGLSAKERLIVLNEKHRDLFQQKPGLERSTKGHEVGHWDLFSSKNETELNFAAETESVFCYRSSTSTLLEVVLNSWTDDSSYSAYRELTKNCDEPHVKSAVDYYASCLSMPRDLLLKTASNYDLLDWKSLYRFAREIDVTISALVVRLQQSNLIYVAPNKTIFKSQDQFLGQKSFLFQ